MTTLEHSTISRSPASRIIEFLSVMLTTVVLAQAIIAVVTLTVIASGAPDPILLDPQSIIVVGSLGSLVALVMRKQTPALVFAVITILLYIGLTIYGLDFVRESHFSVADWVTDVVGDLGSLIPFLGILYLYKKGAGFWNQYPPRAVWKSIAILVVLPVITCSVPLVFPSIDTQNIALQILYTLGPSYFVAAIAYHLAYREANRHVYATLLGLAIMTALMGISQYSMYRDNLGAPQNGQSTDIDAVDKANLIATAASEHLPGHRHGDPWSHRGPAAEASF